MSVELKTKVWENPKATENDVEAAIARAEICYRFSG